MSPGIARDGVLWWYSSENLSPRVTTAFLARQRRLLLPVQFAREHQNQWVDGEDAFTASAEVDAAMCGDWVESDQGEPGHAYVIAVDLGLVSDPSVIGVGHEEDTFVCLDRIITLQGSRAQPVQIAAVERLLLDLADAFTTRRILVESWQGIASAQALQRLGLPVEVATPTPRSNAEQWGVLAQLLSSRRLVLPAHPQLRAELLGLRYEVLAAGVRVTGGSPHQDHAVVLRMLAHALGVERPRVRLVGEAFQWAG